MGKQYMVAVPVVVMLLSAAKESVKYMESHVSGNHAFNGTRKLPKICSFVDSKLKLLAITTDELSPIFSE